MSLGDRLYNLSVDVISGILAWTIKGFLLTAGGLLALHFFAHGNVQVTGDVIAVTISILVWVIIGLSGVVSWLWALNNNCPTVWRRKR